jgi:hypothetical protein
MVLSKDGVPAFTCQQSHEHEHSTHEHASPQRHHPRDSLPPQLHHSFRSSRPVLAIDLLQG